MADLGGYEGVRQAPLPGLPDLPGRPIRRSGGGLCPTVLRRTEADGGISSHPAPAVRCCLQPHLSVEPGCPCLACRSRGPTGEGRDTAGPSSRDGVRALQRPLLHRSQETRWVTSNLGPACSEPGPCQAPVQDVDAETPLSMRPSLRLGCSDRPEIRLLPCLDPPSIPLCVQRGEHTSRPSPSGTSAGWGFRSTGKRANSPLCRGSLFSARSWTRSTSQHVSQRSVLSQC